MDEKLLKYGISTDKAHWNLSPEKLSQISIEKNQAERASSGAINVLTGKFTGRSAKDRFIVKDEITESKIWWGDINIPFDSENFDQLYNKVVEHLSGKEIYVIDARS